MNRFYNELQVSLSNTIIRILLHHYITKIAANYLPSNSHPSHSLRICGKKVDEKAFRGIASQRCSQTTFAPRRLSRRETHRAPKKTRLANIPSPGRARKWIEILQLRSRTESRLGRAAAAAAAASYLAGASNSNQWDCARRGGRKRERFARFRRARGESNLDNEARAKRTYIHNLAALNMLLSFIC